jgi:beta-lactamase regulating signal transducer with metallopeptidase domain/uncharacterized protein YeeX (DUF496 family)
MIDLLQNLFADGNALEWAPWILSFLISTTVLLGGVWVIEKLGLLRSPDLTAFIWRAAIITALLTSLPLGMRYGATLEVSSPTWVEATGSPEQHATVGFEVGGVNESNLNLQEISRKALNPTAVNPEEVHTILEAEPAFAGWFQNLAEGLNLATGLLIFWLLIAGFGLLRLTVGLVMASNYLGSRSTVDETHPAWMQLISLCKNAGVNNIPRLTHSTNLQGPVCLIGNEICLPTWALKELNEKQMASLLAHEMGHLVRHDPLIFIILEVINRVFFFQPLFITASRRLRVVAELAADAWAVEQTKDAKSVARTLFKCAKKISNNKINTQRQPFFKREALFKREDWGLAMANDTSSLKHRVERLVGSSDDNFRSVNGKTKLGLTAIMMVAAFGLPQFQLVEASNSGQLIPTAEPAIGGVAAVPPVTSVAPVFAGAGMGSDNTNFHFKSNGKSIFEHSSKGLDIEAEWKGHLTFSDDESTITAINDNGYFELETKIGSDKKRTIEFSYKQGKLVSEYSVSGKIQPLDAEGKKWLKTELVRLLRLSGMNADERVDRLIKRGGNKAVFEEFKHLGTDYTHRKYIIAFSEAVDFTDKEYATITDLIIDMDSDYEKRVSVVALMDHEKLNSKRSKNLVDVVSSVDSDYETRVILMPLVKHVSFKGNDVNFKTFLNIFANLESDYETRVVLLGFFERHDLKASDIEAILEMAAENIESDYEMRVIITALNDQLGGNKRVVSTAIEAITTIESDYERRVVLTHIMKNSKMDDALWVQVLEASTIIDGEYEKAAVLRAVLLDMPMKDKLVETFRQAMKTIDGDYEYGRVAKALDRKLD